MFRRSSRTRWDDFNGLHKNNATRIAVLLGEFVIRLASTVRSGTGNGNGLHLVRDYLTERGKGPPAGKYMHTTARDGLTVHVFDNYVCADRSQCYQLSQPEIGRILAGVISEEGRVARYGYNDDGIPAAILLRGTWENPPGTAETAENRTTYLEGHDCYLVFTIGKYPEA